MGCLERIGCFLGISFLVLFGCARGDQEDPRREEKAESEFKVALLTPGPVSDAGWGAMAYKALQEIRRVLGATVSHQEIRGAQIRDALRSHAQQGYRLIFGHGYEYNLPSIEVAKDFPHTYFVTSSGSMTFKNVGTFRFYLEQAFYLAGILSAKMSHTGIVAMIGGLDVPSIRSTFNAYRLGVLATKPTMQVIEIFTGQISDIAAVKQATLQAIGRGADIVIHQADVAAQGVFDACRDQNIFAIGSNVDQNNNSSGIVIASAIVRGESFFLNVARRVKQGTFKGNEKLVVGMKEGAVDFVINPHFESLISKETEELLEKTKKDILEGKLTVPKDEF